MAALDAFVATWCERGAGTVYVNSIAGYDLVFPWSDQDAEVRCDAASQVVDGVNRATAVVGLDRTI